MKEGRECEDGAKGGRGSLFLAPLRNSLVLSSPSPSTSSFPVSCFVNSCSFPKKVVVREEGILRPFLPKTTVAESGEKKFVLWFAEFLGFVGKMDIALEKLLECWNIPKR